MNVVFDEKSYLLKEHKRLLQEVKKAKKQGFEWKIELAEKALKIFEVNHAGD